MGISETPDVAVWAKKIRKNDKVSEPPRISALTLHFTENGKELLIDPASKSDVARAGGHTLTDESDYGTEK